MAHEKQLLIVEDDEGFARTLKRSFERRGYDVLLADSLETVTALLGSHRPGFAVVDLKLGPQSGLACVQALHAHDPAMLIVVLTGSPASPPRSRRSSSAQLITSPNRRTPTISKQPSHDPAATRTHRSRLVPPASRRWNGSIFTKCSRTCLLYTSPSPRDRQKSRMPSSA